MAAASEFEYLKRYRDNPYLVRPPTENELPYSDGEPLESDRHVDQLSLLKFPLKEFWKDRNDFHVGTNQFVYYSPEQVKNTDFRGPDVFVVLGVPKRERKSYVIWDENFKSPNVVIELLSPSTIDEDKFKKKLIYQDVLRVPEYYWCDPFSDDFAGFELHEGTYRKMKPDGRGMFQSAQLGLALTRWTGEYSGYEALWLRWAKPDGELLPTGNELAETQRMLANASKVRSDEAGLRADEAVLRADEAVLRADGAALRADKMAALLKQHGINPDA